MIQNKSIRAFFLVLQLACLIWLVGKYQIESSLGLPSFLPYMLGGFAIHACLPKTYRLLFFIILSIGAVFFLFQWIPALVLLGLIFFFFGILQLPISVSLRGIILLACAGGLAFLWLNYPAIIPDSFKVIPIVGSIYMFRASLYLYEVRYQKTAATFQQQLAYFLMLPNFVLTLFPVVDYKLFQRNYYNHPELEIYQKGVRWMVRGFFHLMLYRIIYYFVQPGMEQVDTLAMVLFYAATSYALILRLSGLFHFSAGVLCLFGFNLPAVFHNYFFASDFSDLWRRINIYWRDYVMKVFYYPIYFKLRMLGKYSRTIVSVLIAFAITWMLHSYQWFWLKGSFPIRTVDAIFWGVFGVLVAANAVYQQAVPKNNRFIHQKPQWIKTAVRSLKIIALLSFMSLLWTFWNAPTLSDWWNFMVPVRNAAFAEWIQVGTILLGGFIALFAGLFLFEKNPKLQAFLEPDEGKSLSIFWSLGTLSLFAILCIPTVLNTFQKFTEKPVGHIYETRLSVADDAMMVKGYYEDILITNQLTTPLTDLLHRPDNWVQLADTPAGERTNDWLVNTLVPNQSVVFKDKSFSTNKWGMRDRDCTKANQTGDFRFGFLGGSYVMGSGVNDDEVFDNLLEDQLNSDTSFGISFELLNFAVAGYHLMQSTYQLQEQVSDFDLDVLVVFTHGLDYSKAIKTIRDNFENGDSIPLSFVQEITASQGYFPGQKLSLNPESYKYISTTVIDSCFSTIARLCKAENILPISVYWPRTSEKSSDRDRDEIFQVASSYGFLTLDLGKAYEGYTTNELILAPYDLHPNKLGHQLIAEEMYRAILKETILRALILKKSSASTD